MIFDSFSHYNKLMYDIILIWLSVTMGLVKFTAMMFEQVLRYSGLEEYKQTKFLLKVRFNKLPR